MILGSQQCSKFVDPDFTLKTTLLGEVWVPQNVLHGRSVILPISDNLSNQNFPCD